MTSIVGMLTGLLRNKRIVRSAGLAALCLLIWFMGPRIVFGRTAPLAPALNRLLAILIAIAFWGLYQFIRQRRSRKKEQRLMTDLAASKGDGDPAAVNQAKTEEMAELRRKFERALQMLKTARSIGKRDKQYLYELPWYVIIGAPGCGKTTLLANSGLRFPLTGKVDGDDIPGVGGTRNCDWLFSDEAIFLDTAGRYTTQDSHQAVDAAAWHGFLDLIKKYRPRRPINGVLVAASLSDLLQQTEEEIARRAVQIRQRMAELAQCLGVRFPVYMIFTKCDLVAGFNDLFGRLDADARARVWGETFNLGDARQPQDNIDGFIAQFDASLRRLIQWAFGRIQEERDIRRRSLILSFPRQMALLKPKLKLFLHQTFSSSPYDPFVPLLRGGYLTSGTQEGTPIDRVMGMLAAAYGLDRRQAPVYSGRGKSYFITRLLKAVIFPEAQLAGADPRVERRRRWLQMAAYGAVLVLTVGMMALWSTSYARNKIAMGQVRARIEQYNRLADDNTRWDTAVKSLLVRLNTVCAADAVYDHPGRWMGFGLGQGDKIRAGTNQVYRQLLNDRFLPLIKARLEQRLQAALGRDSEEDAAVLYDLLRTYLMFGQPQKRLDPAVAAARIADDWKHHFAREPELHADLDRHIRSLLRLPPAPIQLNAPLIAEARRNLNAQPLSAQVFAHLQAEALADHRHDFRLADLLGPHGQRVFTTVDGRKPETLMIPGLYTYDGYHGFFMKKGLQYIKQALEENWVLDNYAADQESDLSRLYDDLQRLYFHQYEKQWRELLDNLKVIKARGLTQEIQILDILSGPETPLRPLMAAVEKNTTLYPSGKKAPADAESEQIQAGGTRSALADQALSQAQVPPPALELEKKFQGIHYLVRAKDGAPPPLDHLLESVNSIRNFMMQIASAGDSDENALQKALERMNGSGASTQIKAAQMDFARQPAPLNGWFSSLTASSLELTLTSATSELNAMWKAEVVTPYAAALQGRYPISPQSDADVTIEDFSRFFRPAGTIDSFFQKHLKPFVDKSHTRWRPRRIENKAMPLSSTTLMQLQNAATIRDAFFADGGTHPSLRFELVPVDLDEEVAVFTIDIEGQRAEYSHGPARARQFVWPGPDAGAGVRLTFRTVDGQRITHTESGAWAWLKTLDKAAVESTGQRDRILLTFRLRNCTAHYELRASSVYHPFQLQALRNFRCPESF